MPGALRAAGHRCELHDDHFDHRTEDATWLKAVAANEWIVLTKDERIRYRPLELQAIESARLRAFIVICGNVRGADTAEILLKGNAANPGNPGRPKGPFIYCVYKDSTIKRSR